MHAAGIPDACVVRRDWRDVAGPAAALLGWTALIVAAWAGRWLIGGTPGVVAALTVETVLAAMCGTEAERVLQRQVLLTLDQDGITFGSRACIPWGEVGSVEVFRDRHWRVLRTESARCIGVRAPGARQVSRAGYGPAAQPLSGQRIRRLRRAGRMDLLPGADGTIRLAYQQVAAWRLSRDRLTAAVQVYAPDVPVITGPDWPPDLPPAITWPEAIRALRASPRVRG